MWLNPIRWFSPRRRKQRRALALPDLAPTPTVLSPVTAREGVIAITTFMHRVVDGQVYFPGPVSEPALVGRPWWPSPQLAVPAGAREHFSRLEDRARECEILTWAEIGGSEEINQLVSELLVRFQFTRTVISPRDHLPARWGIFAWQAVVAAYNVLWLVSAVHTGADPNRVEVIRRAIQSWLSSLPGSIKVEWGDLYLFHHLQEVLRGSSTSLAPQVAGAAKKLAEAKEAARAAEESHNKAHGEAWRLLVSRVDEAQLQAKRAERDYLRLKAAGDEFAAMLSRWQQLDPFAHLPRLGLPEALPVKAAITGVRNDGFEHWLVRRMVSLLPHRAEEIAQQHDRLGNIWGADLTFTDDPALSDGEGRWRSRIFFVRFYWLWATSVPDAAQVRGAVSTVDAQRWKSFNAFFAPWRQVQKARLLVAREAPRYGVRREFLVEVSRLREEFGTKLDELAEHLALLPLGPLTASEFSSWGGAKQDYFTESLSIISGQETPAAWQRRFDLLQFYWRWGAAAPSLDNVRRAVPRVDAVQSRYVTFFAPWLHLREVFYRLSYKITEQSLAGLKSDDVPGDVLEKLQAIKDQEAEGDKQFVELLKTTIGDEQTNRFKPQILKHALYRPLEGDVRREFRRQYWQMVNGVEEKIEALSNYLRNVSVAHAAAEN